MVEQEQALVQVCSEAVEEEEEACNTAVAALVAVGLFGEAKQVRAAGCVHPRCSRSS